MNIAIIAPSKFEFQDLVCIDIALRSRSLDRVQMFAEPAGGEDGQLEFTCLGAATTVEVQVKGSESTLDLAKLASHLAHFPDRKGENTLLDRLIEDKGRFALFVVSGRCVDAVSSFLIKRMPEEILQRSVSAPSAEAFRMDYARALGTLAEDDTALWKARHAHLIKTANEIDQATLRSALGRVLILEQQTSEDVETRIVNTLAKLGVPTGSAAHAIGEMRERVQSAKGARIDVIASICDVIERYAPSTIRPSDYVSRGLENQMLADLLASHVLLLSGSPRTGKTFTARELASKLQVNGYEAKECFSVLEASRFLLDGAKACRVAILDDPFGGTHPVQNAAQELAQLKDLVTRANAAKLLIVVQAKDRIFGVFNTSTLSGARLHSHVWVDLDAHSAELATKLWRDLGSRGKVSRALYQSVLDAFGGSEVTLEPGFLSYLALNSDRLGEAPTLEKALRLAKEDASDLGRALAAETSANLLQVLAIGTTPGISLAMDELAFLTSRGRTDLPGYVEVSGKESNWRLDESVPAPSGLASYAPVPELAETHRVSVRNLERRGIVEVSPGQQISFVHPVFRAASESLVDFSSTLDRQDLLALIEKSLLCLSPHTAKAAAKNLAWLAEHMNGDGLEALFRVAERGLGSIFISTRDVCFSFLVSRMDEVGAKLEDVQSWIRQASFVSLSDVSWTYGEATLSKVDGSGTLRVPSSLSSIFDATDSAMVRAFMEDDSVRCSAEVAWEGAKFFDQNPKEMTLDYMHRLLSYDEASIRARAISSWLREHRDHDDLVLTRIAAERHPQVLSEALTALRDSWAKVSQDRLSRVMSTLVPAWSNPYSSVVLISWCLVLDKTHEFEAWGLLGRLLPTVLKHLPGTIEFSDARLHGIVSRSAPHLSHADMVAICAEWVGLVKRINGVRSPTAYEITVAELIVKFLPPGASRTGLIRDLLDVPGTAIPARVLAEISDIWPQLSVDEQALVKELLSELRSDSLWLNAVLLTRRHLDSGLRDELFHMRGWDPDSNKKLRERLPSDVLRASIGMYASDTNEFHVLELTGQSIDYLDQELELIALDPDDPFFPFAWRHISYSGDDDRVLGLLQVWQSSSWEPVFEQMFAALLDRCDDMPKAWHFLLEQASAPSVRSQWIERMAWSANSYLNDISDAARFLSGEHLKEFLNKLPIDGTLLMLVNGMLQLPKFEELETKVAEFLGRIFRGQGPVMHATCSRVQRLLTHSGQSESELYQVVEAYRTRLIGEIQRRREYHDVALEGWTFGYR
ncbi:hypothetical protein U4I95_02475 [Stenotrophomonas maltophilia]|uniref:nSTAND3 domain-containing NTPase n=1 Tax=Stenotrophomonas maltophilia TaxID=40324 RepID=UPI0013D9C941|nr:hypothetical protein [Stenotrophomonas maltophilia]MDZ5789343.1 hypothetical protein [Stenotrophomonas maltophilia]